MGGRNVPEISPLGWFHTGMGAFALVCGVAALVKYKEITLTTRSGQVYLLATLITASTALAIFQRGTFGPGHALAVLTLLALAAGFVVSKTNLLGRWSRYFVALSFSATLLFHSVPAVTDALLRLPVGNPVATSLENPILRACYLVLLALFVVGITVQMVWISRAVRAHQTQ